MVSLILAGYGNFRIRIQFNPHIRPKRQRFIVIRALVTCVYELLAAPRTTAAQSASLSIPTSIYDHVRRKRARATKAPAHQARTAPGQPGVES